MNNIVNDYFWQNDKVRLKSAEAEDWEQYYLSYFDTKNRVYFQGKVQLPLSKESAKEAWVDYIEEVKKIGGICLVIETLDGIGVGFLTFVRIDERNGIFNLGIQISDQYRSQGYGSAAFSLALKYGFEERRLNKFQSFVIEGNTSANVLVKFGCVKEGVIRKATFHSGKYWDHIYYGLLAEEYFSMLHKNSIQV